ncbi:MAG: hypothetical protein PVG07_08880 [Acidobacteriota bacterium]
MSRIAPVAALAILLVLPCRAGVGAEPGPRDASEEPGSGWLLGGDRPGDYAVELEPSGGRLGTAAALLRSAVPHPEGFVSVMRWIEAEPHRESRLRLTAWLQAEDVTGWSGLWMRVDDLDAEGRTGVLAFDNMRGRPVRGTTGWRKVRVVLDVPEEADRIYYGFLLSGEGAVRADQFELEEVEPDEVRSTARLRLSTKPHNLDFDHPPGEPERAPEEGADPPP